MPELTEKERETLKELSIKKGYKVVYAYWDSNNDGIMTCLECHKPVVSQNSLHMCPECKGVVIFM